MRGKKLQSNEAAELNVLGLIHHSHAAAAQHFQNAVMGNRATDPLLVSMSISTPLRIMGKGFRRHLDGRGVDYIHGSVMSEQ
jgi:hypothetical protein